MYRRIYPQEFEREEKRKKIELSDFLFFVLLFVPLWNLILHVEWNVVMMNININLYRRSLLLSSLNLILEINSYGVDKNKRIYI